MKQLTRHLTFNKSNGRWQKKIDGKVRYFGTSRCSEREALDCLDQFILGMVAPPVIAGAETMPLEHVAERFIQDCEKRVADGLLSPATVSEYERIIGQFIRNIGGRRLAAALTPADFRTARIKWKVGPYALARYVRAIRTMFTWAEDTGIIIREPRYGSEFSPPARKAVRDIEADGERMFTDDELRAMLAHPLCNGTLRACVLLGLNAGMYPIDCADLLWREIKSIDGVICIDRIRWKTDVPHRAPLWPETLAAIEQHRLPLSAPDGRVFLSPSGGPLTLRESRTSYLGDLFDELRKGANIGRYGVGFGSLRHTHVSAMGDCGDEGAAERLRGHTVGKDRGAVKKHYDKVPMTRLVKVAEHARDRLYLRILNNPSSPLPSPLPSKQRREAGGQLPARRGIARSTPSE